MGNLIPCWRSIGLSGDNGDGTTGRSYHWRVYTSSKTPRLAFNGTGEAGRYLIDGETWYMMKAIYPYSGVTDPGRSNNWHDVPASGYIWQSVSPCAFDINPNGGGHDLPIGGPIEFVIEYSGSCSGATTLAGGGKSTHYKVPLALDQWNYIFYKIKFKVDCTGSLQIFLQNSTTATSDSPVVDLVNVRTLNNTSGWYPACQGWEGHYYASGFNSGPNIKIDQTAMLYGVSWSDCYNDIPSFVKEWGSSRASTTDLAAVDITTFKLPDALGISGGGGGSTGGGGGTTGGGGTIPNVRASGSGAASSGTTLAVPYPTVGAGDLLVCHVCVNDNSDTPTTPAGWTRTRNADYINSGGTPPTDPVQAQTWVFTKTATGSETGNLSITISGGTAYGRMYSIQNPGPIGAGTFRSDSSSVFAPPGITTTSANSLVLLLGAIRGNRTLSSLTGETGTDYTEATATYAATVSLELQTGSRATAGPISGGSTSMTAAAFNCVALEIQSAPPSFPVNQIAPAVPPADARVGTALTCDTGTWTNTPTSYTYQWQQGDRTGATWSDIAAATSSSYTPVSGDRNHKIRCNVTATNAGGSATASSNSTLIVDAANQKAHDGSIESEGFGDWLGNSGGETLSQITSPVSDGSAALQFSTPGSGTFEGVFWRPAVGNGLVCVTGDIVTVDMDLQTAVGGRTLRIAINEYDGTGAFLRSSTTTLSTTTSYQSISTLTATMGANTTLAQVSVTTGSSVVSLIGRLDNFLLTQTPHVPTNSVAPTVGGLAIVGGTLTVSPGTWAGVVSYVYQWYKDGVSIGGATNSTYVVQAGDAGHTITCRVAGVNTTGTSSYVASSNSASIPVSSPLPANSVAPTISGTASVGSTLTVDEGTWVNAVSYVYMWYRDGLFIGGATNKTYVVQRADRGKTLLCRVAGVNATGTSAYVASSNSIDIPVGSGVATLTATALVRPKDGLNVPFTPGSAAVPGKSQGDLSADPI